VYLSLHHMWIETVEIGQCWPAAAVNIQTHLHEDQLGTAGVETPRFLSRSNRNSAHIHNQQSLSASFARLRNPPVIRPNTNQLFHLMWICCTSCTYRLSMLVSVEGDFWYRYFRLSEQHASGCIWLSKHDFLLMLLRSMWNRCRVISR